MKISPKSHLNLSFLSKSFVKYSVSLLNPSLECSIVLPDLACLVTMFNKTQGGEIPTHARVILPTVCQFERLIFAIHISLSHYFLLLSLSRSVIFLLGTLRWLWGAQAILSIRAFRHAVLQLYLHLIGLFLESSRVDII